MVYISSVGLGKPKVSLHQSDAKRLVLDLFKSERSKVNRLLPIFDTTKIESRQLATKVDWYKTEQSFQSRNNLYKQETIALSLEAIDECLHNSFLTETIPYEAIDLIIFVSSTGISTPSIDAYLINERPFKESIVRMPLWGLGCGGGAIGLSRAIDWLKLNPTKTALVVCAELCSLTFQPSDVSTSNIVGTALFGDGVAAALLVGEASSYVTVLPNQQLRAEETNSFLKKDTLQIMGWDITNKGFEVIFSKKIPRLVKLLWKEHFNQFIDKLNLEINDLDMLIAHPGGRKVLEEMENVLKGNASLLKHSYDVLQNHGNMSSATVLYVLKQYIEKVYSQRTSVDKDWAILSALGPGFCSELVAVRWVEL